MDQEFIDAVKKLPLEERIKVVAVQHHLNKWAEDDDKVQEKLAKLRKEFVYKMVEYQREVNQLVSGQRQPKPEELKDFPEVVQDQPPKLLDNYWSKVFQNHLLTKQLLTEEDVKVLGSLKGIDVELGENGKNYKLLFHFDTNEYFDACVLFKEYVFNDEEDKELQKLNSSEIKWKKGKNITKKIKKQKQKNQKSGQIREVEKEENAPSFFHYFDNIEKITEEEEKEDRMEFDLELGNTILHSILPRSIGYYLGVEQDMVEDEDLDLEEVDDDEEDDENGNDEDQ